MKTTVVVGPGAMGCLLAARLSEGGCPVVLLDKDVARARRIGEAGIRVEAEGGRERRVRVCAATDARTVEEDIAAVYVCVKAGDTRGAVGGGGPWVAGGATVVSWQNGLGNAETIADAVGWERVVCASTLLGSTLLGAGHVRCAGEGKTLLGGFNAAGAKRADGEVDRLRGAGLAAERAEDVTSLLWSKLAVNAAVNALTALSGVPNGELLADETLRGRMRRAAREAAAVAAARGIRLLFGDAAARAEEVCRLTAGNVSSMLQDIRRGRRTEVEWINGVIVREGARLGVATPENEALLAAVKEKEAEKGATG